MVEGDLGSFSTCFKPFWGHLGGFLGHLRSVWKWGGFGAVGGILGPFQGDLGHFGAVLGPISSGGISVHFRAFHTCFRPVLGPLLGPGFGAFQPISGLFQAQFQEFWGIPACLGPILGCLRPVWVHFGSVSGHFRTFFWPCFRRLCSHLEAFWQLLDQFQVPLQAFWALIRPISGHFWAF